MVLNLCLKQNAHKRCPFIVLSSHENDKRMRAKQYITGVNYLYLAFCMVCSGKKHVLNYQQNTRKKLHKSHAKESTNYVLFVVFFNNKILFDFFLPQISILKTFTISFIAHLALIRHFNDCTKLNQFNKKKKSKNFKSIPFTITFHTLTMFLIDQCVSDWNVYAIAWQRLINV